MRAQLIAISLLIGACGGDDEAPPPPPSNPRPPPAAAAAAAGGPMRAIARIEDEVVCPTPTDAKKCDPNVTTCAAGQYCIAAGSGHYCGSCPERDAIRHTFKPRDFQGSDLRDPFMSFVINQPGLAAIGDDTAIDKTQKCMRRDQMVASNYSYQTLKLVGIVAQGTQRKVLMMDSGNLGHIVKKGDCVGKEKALVKDIGAGYVTFVITPTATAAGQREPEEHSVQLYPMQVSVNAQLEDSGMRNPSAPVVAPPGGRTMVEPATRVDPPPTTTSGPTTTPTVEPPPTLPAQPPVQLRP
ncbi:MAG: pilus assembly protein PilP [Myxococcota bacterium]|nr:pilus assembly protein PilP [Myxococcota bacterium]